jgi:hypothetical protein
MALAGGLYIHPACLSFIPLASRYFDYGQVYELL